MVAILLVFGVLAALVQAQGQNQAVQQPKVVVEGFSIGEPLHIECLNDQAQWGPGPICRESGAQLKFQFGVEQFFACTLDVDPPLFRTLLRIINSEATWSCRIPMYRNPPVTTTFAYLPFILPIWGIQQNTNNIVVNTHMNFIFHVDNGFIIGAAAYPVRDRFMIINENGGILMLHGPSKWFWRGSFTSISSASAQASHSHQAPAPKATVAVAVTTSPPAHQLTPKTDKPNANAPVLTKNLVFWGLILMISVLLTILGLTLVYKNILKPRLVQQHLKKD